jgi:hypothetical protein
LAAFAETRMTGTNASVKALKHSNPLSSLSEVRQQGLAGLWLAVPATGGQAQTGFCRIV